MINLMHLHSHLHLMCITEAFSHVNMMLVASAEQNDQPGRMWDVVILAWPRA